MKMDNYKLFKDYAEDVAKKFIKIDKNMPLRIISHHDADGISACAILLKLLNLDNRRYTLTVVQQLNKDLLYLLSKEDYKYYFFVDLGSGQLKEITKFLKDKIVFILDHHIPAEVKIEENIIHLNPILFGIDGGLEISGAGVVYFFARAVNKEIENLAHIAIIGAIGDLQEKNGFLTLNQEILDTAVQLNKMKVERGLRLFGAQTRPLHKVLEYSTDPYIPDVTGSESGAIQFLLQLGINPKRGNKWRKFIHLSEDEIKKLVAGIVMKRLNEDNPEDILGNVYILVEEKEENPTRDAREFSTLLNACGRMGNASLGIGTCLGDEKIKKKAIENMVRYKREIVSSLRWYEKNRNTEHVIKGKKFLIINAKNNIKSSLIGTIASIISRSVEVEKGTYILTMADVLDGTIKVSLRKAGKNNEDLRELIKIICENIENAQFGGHKSASGAIIPLSKEQEFIKRAKLILSKKAIEEEVL